ncbi:DUF1697 domain-containing protein [Sphingomonas oligophenolica]|uniref:DUF1697 domain-containing protein n=1 Tax=Sphingomonas oligophenolica TaxID=301154 RepID=A0A502CB08_9SPHN|nr:DUF1697 domain-containing protein [Sphingomonas oligophenolica]TPG10367.1 DUF1697 domain-containing protein [Sphingomonas oligophenolica]
MKWAALLRGVNVGGNRKLPMADLRSFVEGLGYGEVQTLLASGNVVFETDERDAAAIESTLATAATKTLRLDTDWFVRSHADLAAIIEANPFPDAAETRPNHVLVLFHAEEFPAGKIDALGEAYDGPERLAAVGRELFIDFPDGIGRSTLHPAMAKGKFPKVATGRNWNTVTKLATLTA